VRNVIDKWSKLSANTIFEGKNSDGVRYLNEFLKDYQDTIKPTEPIYGSCLKCVQKYYYELLNYTKMATSTKYKLKPKYEGITLFGTGLVITNATLTDELAEQLLAEHPAGATLFEEVAKKSKSDTKKKTPSKEVIEKTEE
jgi:hypothetical protein